MKLLRGAACRKRELCKLIPLETLCSHSFLLILFLSLSLLSHGRLRREEEMELREELSTSGWDTRAAVQTLSPPPLDVGILALPAV